MTHKVIDGFPFFNCKMLVCSVSFWFHLAEPEDSEDIGGPVLHAESPSGLQALAIAGEFFNTFLEKE